MTAVQEKKVIYLTAQQAKVFELFVAGRNMKEIAMAIGVSYSRVVNILNEIVIKCGYTSRRELLINAKDIEVVIK